MSPLGELDAAIFAELQRDGRVAFTALAERLGVSEAYVRRRVKRLSEADVLSITAVADPALLGLEEMAWIGLVVAPARLRAVTRALVELPEVDYVVVCSGEFNVMAEVTCPSSRELYRLLLELRRIDGVRRTETFVYLDLVRQQFRWPVGEGDPRPERTDGSARTGRPEPLGALDVSIIRELERDGRASFRDIGQRLGVSERVVSRRFTDLTSRGVLQVIAVGNPVNLGFTEMAWLGITLAERAELEEVSVALTEIGAIDYVVVTAGRFDVMAEAVCRDRAELLRMLERDVGGIQGIANIEAFLYLELLYKSSAGAWGASRARTAPAAGDSVTPLADSVAPLTRRVG
jgi:DNA-binding Lrp family transcriptional regulator